MLRESPTTFAPVARKRSVMKDPSPPFAPVMKTTLSLILIRILDGQDCRLGRLHRGSSKKFPSNRSGALPTLKTGERDVVLDKGPCPLLNAVASFFGNAYGSRVGIIDVLQSSQLRATTDSSVRGKVSMVESEVNLTKTYDAIVIGSGAAGGMAAHVLTSHGLQVLLLEAGKKLPIEKELRSMEWPYDNPYRGQLPPDSHSLSFNEYTIRNPPYGPGFEKAKHLKSYIGSTDYLKNIVVDERENPFTGTNYAWVRARCLGGKTNIWGRLALRLSDYDFKAKSHDGYGEDWPISYADLEPYYDKVDRYLGISGVKENLPHLPDSLFQRPTKLNVGEVKLRHSLAEMGRVLTPYRAGVTTDGVKHNKYRSKCYGRGACDRRPGGCDIHAAFDSPTGLIYPAMDTGHLTVRPNSTAHEVLVDKNTGRARGVAFLDSVTHKSYEAKAKVVILAASTLESARLLLLSRSPQHPNVLGNSSGHVGHNFCEHVMGPGVAGLIKELVGKPHTLDDGRPGGFYIPRFRNLKDRQPGFIRGYGYEGNSGHSMFPAHVMDTAGFGGQFKKNV